MLYPFTSFDVLAVQLRLTECDAAAAPVPVRLVEEGELVALLVNVAVPEAEPVAVGENVTVKFTLLPEAIVTGNESPVTVNSEPFVPPTLTAVTFTLPPEADRVPVCVPLEPTVTLPTGTGFGLTLNVACAAATEVPLRGTFNVVFEASEATATLPEKLELTEAGANFTLKVVVAPAANVTGVVIPETVNPVPLAVTDET